jgi:hypothetical protein
MDANVNADDLRRLRKQIEATRRSIDEAVTRLTATLRDVHWRDPSRERFEREFMEVLNRTKSFVREADRFLPELDRKARAIDMFKGR